MKIAYKLVLFFCLLAFQHLQAQSSTQTIRFSNLKNRAGKLYIGWYNSEADFMQPAKSVYEKFVEVTGKDSLDIPFEGIKPGIYAVSVFFDLNDNATLDKNGFGIPKEPYGFSNNVLPLTRPASFEESRFEVKEADTLQVIRLK